MWVIFSVRVTIVKLLEASRGLYLVYLTLAEYILVPHVQRILEYT